MKIIWVVNNIFPQVAKYLDLPIPVVGGWMYGLAEKLSKTDLELTIITSNSRIEMDEQINGIRFVLLKTKLPKSVYDSGLEKKWKKIVGQIKPSLIHIHGTEYALGLPLLHSCPNEKYVVSIQGLISVYTRYYDGGMSLGDILGNLTIRDIVRFDNILQAKKKFFKKGTWEKKYLMAAKNVIGRTTWDYQHTGQLYPKRNYFFCNESLRAPFYDSKKWDINNKKEYTIFLSQGGYPLKGLHQVLKAVSLLRNQFDNITIRIAGNNIIDKKFWRLSGYGMYIQKLIKTFGLEKNVIFLGPLVANEMIKEYSQCHVFICPSSIENSPNSLGEAQLLGVPCIASYVGGVPDMISHGEDGLLYRFEEIEMLAQYLREIFTNNTLAQKLSQKAILSAAERHDPAHNAINTINIYKKIIGTS